MAKDKLIYASDARRAILKEDPKLAYCIDDIPGVDVPKWISVKDRLPEKSGEVLGYHTQWGVSRYYYHYSLLGTDWKHITHWMPLPEPPKGE